MSADRSATRERHSWRCAHCQVWGTGVWAVRDGPAGPRVRPFVFGRLLILTEMQSLCNNCGLVLRARQEAAQLVARAAQGRAARRAVTRVDSSLGAISSGPRGVCRVFPAGANEPTAAAAAPARRRVGPATLDVRNRQPATIFPCVPASESVSLGYCFDSSRHVEAELSRKQTGAGGQVGMQRCMYFSSHGNARRRHASGENGGW